MFKSEGIVSTQVLYLTVRSEVRSAWCRADLKHVQMVQVLTHDSLLTTRGSIPGLPFRVGNRKSSCLAWLPS